ncbi:hypothetical protein Pedsa_0608 [Pseudopedobacter saltans DSM 12145]|uniref:Uncharacterized protein n=1 Tax=Pseudopedobacter saltans (strain ATCC 51119 / DSM 12145 / JCM 21818 / CCUG 39354 / LMG 10337 / NBRC 100064 / NCIMB 13643) TaxID=762903 RepID=F0S7G0_PSESL|nr:hypothetical protein [Pseudopedobacter saltans]ADY51185.1 hypothetical protein Pedsa_0608 [Pseudopedobacter saltans DSM 12145]
MDNKVKSALESLFNTFSALEGITAQQELKTLVNIFESDKDFMAKVADMDEVFDSSPKLDSLREITFDLLLTNFFAEDTKKLEEDYLESPEWAKIEEATLDRGTELLNMMIYIKECEDEEIRPSLDDYLKEFLLVEEDEFQDEHRIYEDIIANQILMESNLKEIAKVSNRLSPDSELRELFYPIMAYFYDINPKESYLKEFKELSEDPAYDTAVLNLLLAYSGHTN